ncbi:copper amine oxidase N-terminal domain-containing protein [Paenibacillus sacheonensis]|uniref:Copper amine oxidase-like N-terminal domain-containing protein n=1 Tax=Paenibacillus sacheonensis TaxID=742054 RepID=A0A7X5C1F8_9BACL|nr:copper amine oxidase N-terminal domain-containing protein [Paenibacillus sacheonensis]MBM7564846.1 hypothetical protein [Paenibacillus sacheonensis]NBC69394.1 hypothetical protein [Paenibacillus sacheonensis]
MNRRRMAAAIAAAVMAGVILAPTGAERTYADGAAPATRIEVMGKALTPGEVPLVDHGRVLVPLRAVTEAFGANVQWDAKTSTVSVRKWSVTVRFKAFSSAAVVDRAYPGGANRSTDKLDVPMKLRGNRAYVPLRYLAAQFGYAADWHDGTVFIASPLSKQKHDTLNTGDLAKAREIAVLLGYDAQYAIKPMTAGNVGEADGITMLFPEGEALRFIRIAGDLVEQVEIVDDHAVVTWGARLSGTTADQLRSFMNRKWTGGVGEAPRAGGDYIYYNSGIFGETGWTEYGIVDAEGAFTQTGYRHYGFGETDTETGTLEIAKKGEKRTDAAGS